MVVGGLRRRSALSNCAAGMAGAAIRLVDASIDACFARPELSTHWRANPHSMQSLQLPRQAGWVALPREPFALGWGANLTVPKLAFPRDEWYLKR